MLIFRVSLLQFYCDEMVEVKLTVAFFSLETTLFLDFILPELLVRIFAPHLPNTAPNLDELGIFVGGCGGDWCLQRSGWL